MLKKESRKSANAEKVVREGARNLLQLLRRRSLVVCERYLHYFDLVVQRNENKYATQSLCSLSV